MPNLSKALVKTSRLSRYSWVCFSKKECLFACSRPAATASCRGELVQKTMRVDAASVGPMMEGGPISQPTRQPVAAKASEERAEFSSSCTSQLGVTHSLLTTPLPCDPTYQVTWQIEDALFHRTQDNRTVEGIYSNCV